jgi:hypothetical protein
MRPSTFAESRFIPQPAGEIAAGIADLSRWPEFAETAGGTEVVWRLEMHPRSAPARPALWVISLLMRRAIARHLAQMAG